MNTYKKSSWYPSAIRKYPLPKVRILAFWKISIRRFFGWLGRRNRYGSIQYLKENTHVKFHRSLINNNEVWDVWNFLYKSACGLVGLDGKITNVHLRNFPGWYRGVKHTCIPNFNQIGQFLQKLSILKKILAGRLVGLVCVIGFQKNWWLHSVLTWCEYLQKIELISLSNKKISTTKSQNISILKNLYKTLFWLVGPIKLIWFD